MNPEQVRAFMRSVRWSARNARAYDRHAAVSRRAEWKTVIAAALDGVPPEMQVLDVGTGTGFVAGILAELGYEVLGVDLSPAMLERARENLARLNVASRVSLREGTAEALNLPDASVEGIISRWVLWTLPEPERGIQEMARVLKPGGRLVIIDGQPVEQGLLGRTRSGLADFLLTGRRPGWNRGFWDQVSPHLPRMGMAQILASLHRHGLVRIRTQEALERTVEGSVRTFLLGGGWNSFLVQGDRPAC